MALKNKIHFDIDTLETIADTQGQAIDTLESQASSADDHIADLNNPHQVTAAQVGAVTQDELTNAITAVVEDLDWKEMVPTFADLAIEYPEPDEGWTASVAADNITYRYNGTEWVPILGALSPLATANNNGLISKEDFIKLDGITPGAKPDQSAAQVPFDNQDTNLISSSVQGALEELDFKKLNATDLSTTLAFYSTDKPSDILEPSFRLVTSISDPDYPVSPVNINTPAILGQNQQVGQLVSDPGVIIGNPGVITINTIGQIRKISGNANQRANFYYEVYRYDGVLEQLEAQPTAVSNVTPTVNSTSYEQFFASAVFNNGVFGPLDRIVVRYYANQVENSGAVYQFQFGGENPVRTLFPVPVEVIPAPDASKIFVDTGDFDGILNGNDNTVQQALDTLDDHNHNDLYYTKDQLRPVTGDPLVDDFAVTGILDGRYAIQPNIDTIIGDVSALDGRVSTLEDMPAPTGGGELQVFETTVDVNNWQPVQSFFVNTINLSPTQQLDLGFTAAFFGFQQPESGIGNEVDENSNTGFAPTTFTLSSTSQTGPITLTKPTGGGVFNSRYIGAQLFFGQDNFTTNAAYIVTEALNDNQLIIYWNDGEQLTETQFFHNQQGANLVFVDFVKLVVNQNDEAGFATGNFVNQLNQFINPLDPPKRLTMGRYEYQTNQWLKFDVPNGLQLQSVAPFGTASGGLANEAGVVGRVYFAMILDNEAYVANAQGLRKIAFVDGNNDLFFNSSPDYLGENFVQFGQGDNQNQLERIASQIIAAQPVTRTTAADWAAAPALPDTTNVSGFSFAFGLQPNNENEPVEFFGMQVEFGNGETPFDQNDHVLVDLNITPTYLSNSKAVDTAWSKIKGVNTQPNGVLQFIATEAPFTSVEIQVGVIK